MPRRIPGNKVGRVPPARPRTPERQSSRETIDILTAKVGRGHDLLFEECELFEKAWVKLDAFERRDTYRLLEQAYRDSGREPPRALHGWEKATPKRLAKNLFGGKPKQVLKREKERLQDLARELGSGPNAEWFEEHQGTVAHAKDAVKSLPKLPRGSDLTFRVEVQGSVEALGTGAVAIKGRHWGEVDPETGARKVDDYHGNSVKVAGNHVAFLESDDGSRKVQEVLVRGVPGSPVGVLKGALFKPESRSDQEVWRFRGYAPPVPLVDGFVFEGGGSVGAKVGVGEVGKAGFEVALAEPRIEELLRPLNAPAERALDKAAEAIDRVGQEVANTAQKAQQSASRLLHPRTSKPDDFESDS